MGPSIKDVRREEGISQMRTEGGGKGPCGPPQAGTFFRMWKINSTSYYTARPYIYIYSDIVQCMTEHVLRKIHHCTFGRKNFSTTFFRILSKNVTCYPSKILMTFFSSLPYFTDYPSFMFLNSTFSPQKFLNDLFRILPRNFTFYLSKILMTFF